MITHKTPGQILIEASAEKFLEKINEEYKKALYDSLTYGVGYLEFTAGDSIPKHVPIEKIKRKP